jgi:hypothetical protein
MSKPLEVREGVYHDRKPEDVVMRAQEELRKFSSVNAVHFEKPTVYLDPVYTYTTTSAGSGPITNPITPGSGKPLISLEDWNQSKWEKAHPPKTPLWNGIACPKCGKEMFDVDPDYILCSMPPQVEVGCACGFRGTRFV